MNVLHVSTSDFAYVNDLSLAVAVAVAYTMLVCCAKLAQPHMPVVHVPRFLLVLFNQFQVVVSLACVWYLWPVITSSPTGCWMGIDIPQTHPIASQLTKGMYFHLLSKYIDLVDTVFHMIRGKWDKVSFLHVSHHATILPIWAWLVFKGYTLTPTLAFGALLNSMVHTIMYEHYAVAYLGVRHPFKPLITMIQILQFCVLLRHALIMTQDSQLNTNGQFNPAYVQVGYMIFMLSMFLPFFLKSYAFREIRPKKPKSTQEDPNNEMKEE